ncbi:MAG: DsbA family protein [Tannerella sp.]|jgi:protein disulfide-isomerase|nr:DsbA family protein [Tannerella sp.]
MKADKMRIDIWSDIACPYCYKGKHLLEEALEGFPQAADVELRLHSYELRPGAEKNNTADALRLVQLAQEKGLAPEMEEALFTAYFDRKEDVSNPALLLHLGKGVGLEETEIRQLLAGDRFRQSLTDDQREAEEKYALEYIPFYLLNESLVIQGILSAEDYAKALREAYVGWKAGEKGKAERKEGRACSADGKSCRI